MRNWILNRDNGFIPEVAPCITLEYSTAIRLLSIGPLHVVEAMTIRLPNINLHIRDWFAINVLDSTDTQERFAIVIVGQVTAGFNVFGIVGVKWSENGSFSGIWRLRVG